MVGLALLHSLADIFPPALMLIDDLHSLPEIHAELMCFLDSIAEIVRINEENRKQYLWRQREHVLLFSNFRELLAANRRNSKNLPVVVGTGLAVISRPQGTSFDRIANNLSIRLKENEIKISWVVGQCWEDYRDECRRDAQDYQLSALPKFEFLHRPLGEDAKSFYLEVFDWYPTSFEQTFYILGRK